MYHHEMLSPALEMESPPEWAELLLLAVVALLVAIPFALEAM
jgi:hypothetical protein